MITYNVDFCRQYDVVVVGGGISGCCAALASARHGAKTAIVEATGFLGGVAASGFPWNGFHNYQEKRLVIKGIPLEIVNRMQKEGFASDFHLDPVMESLVYVNGPMLKITLEEMMLEAGVKVYYHSLASQVRKEGNRLTGIIIHNRQGCQILEGAVFIDATDSADVAIRAGADYQIGRTVDGKTQVASTAFILGNIDMDQLIGYLEQNPSKVRPRSFTKAELDYVIQSLRKSPLSCIGSFSELIEQAKKDGLDMPFRNIISATIYPSQRQLLSVATKVIGANPRDVDNISEAERQGRLQVKTLFNFFRSYVPGCKEASLLQIAHQIGVRETNHIVGEYCLTAEDLLKGTPFPDAVALGSYIMDIHSPDHGGVEPCTELPTYSIPYRSLIPKGLEGLLVTGRCISATHEAMSAFRVIAILAAIGEGCGTAAALTAISKGQVRTLRVKKLRQKLVDAGCELAQKVDKQND